MSDVEQKAAGTVAGGAVLAVGSITALLTFVFAVGIFMAAL